MNIQLGWLDLDGENVLTRLAGIVAVVRDRHQALDGRDAQPREEPERRGCTGNCQVEGHSECRSPSGVSLCMAIVLAA